jgi:hypothetical protein
MSCEAKRYFRNRVEVEGIEPERLWYENELGQLVLEDEDEFAFVEAGDPRFYPVDLKID